MARPHEQRLRPWGASVIVGVAGLVAPADICLGFRDPARQQRAVPVPHQIFAQQHPGNGKGVPVKKIMAQSGHGSPSCYFGGKSVKTDKSLLIFSAAFAFFGEVAVSLLQSGRISSIIAIFDTLCIFFHNYP